MFNKELLLCNYIILELFTEFSQNYVLFSYVYWRWKHKQRCECSVVLHQENRLLFGYREHCKEIKFFF